MIDELRAYIDELFEQAPKTRAAYELKEELMANSTERYLDLVESKVPEKEALDIVINSIGDIDQLFPHVEKKTVYPQMDNETRKKTALLKSVAVGMYIVGFCLMVTIEEFSPLRNLGFIVMLLVAAVATGILVYTAYAYPNYKKTDDTVVEEFKEWNSSNKRRKSLLSAVSTIVWMVTLILYFLISFSTNAWHITWIIFLVGVCAQAIVTLMFQLGDYK